MTFKKRIGLLSAMLVLAAILVSLFAVPAASANLDYSANGATNKQKLTSSMLLESIFGDGIAIGEEERLYLDEYGNESITYSKILPSGNVTSEYDVQSGVLDVTAKAYTYKSVSGLKMTWTPASVRFGDLSAQLVYNEATAEYSAKIENIPEGYATDAVVTYTADITVAEGVINGLLNKAYNDGKAWSEYIIYSAALEEYKEKLALYQQYLVDARVYDDRCIEYQAYLKEKAEFDEAQLIFAQYEKELAKYNTDYAEYVKYLAEKEEYDKNLAAYNQYVVNYEIVKEQLAIIDGTDKGLPTIGRPLRGAILGPTVTQVIENKDAIANEVTGVDGSVIDLAGEATENLRELFDGYFSQKGEADRYIYYSLNYEEFKNNFTNLLRTLAFLYDNGKVKFALAEMEMTEKYRILLAQLYYVVIALNDSPVSKYDTGYFDSSYRIEGKKPISYVENVPYVKDTNNAVPLPGGYPSKVEKPTEPTPVTEPTKPETVAKPIAPTTVADPGEPPDAVDEPKLPSPVAVPDSRVIKNGVIPDGIKAIASAYDDGKLAERSEIEGDRRLTLFATATKRVVNVDEVTVRFYGTHGELLASVTADRGTYLEFEGEIPEKTSDDKYYTFVGWVDSEGNTVDMTSIDPDGKELSVYPKFEEVYKTFTVTWCVESVVTEEEYRYGEMPIYSSVPLKANEGEFKYVFSGWNRQPTAVVADATYTAQFKKVPLVVDSLGNGAKIDLTSDPASVFVDCTDGVGRSYELVDILTLAKKEMRSVTVKLDGGTVTFTFAELVAILDSGATNLSILASRYSQGEGSAYSFKLSLTRPDGTVPDSALRGTLSIPCEIESPGNTTVIYFDGDEQLSLRANITGDGISAPILANTLYRTLTEYSVNLVQYADVNLSVDKTTAKPGDVIRVSFFAPDDRRVTKLYYISSNGDRVAISGNSFVMPADSITVGLEFQYITYTVRFTSDGKVIYTVTCKPGEIPKFPGKPTKASDSDYTYEFIGWDSELSAVTGNTVYNAEYEKTPIVKEAPKEGLIITPRVLRIIVLVLVVLIYAAIILLPCVIIVIVKVVRRCMRRAKKMAKSAAKS